MLDTKIRLNVAPNAFGSENIVAHDEPHAVESVKCCIKVINHLHCVSMFTVMFLKFKPLLLD